MGADYLRRELHPVSWAAGRDIHADAAGDRAVRIRAGPIFVFLCLNLIQFIIGSYPEPRIAGASVALSPFMVLFAVFFGSFLWGVAGAFIGVPHAPLNSRRTG